MTVRRQLFDDVAEQYDAGRPDYPAALFDLVESVLGMPFLTATVADVGAGTGIASRALAGRGAKVVAVDPGGGVLRVLRRHGSRAVAVRGDGDALPLRDGAVDLVTYAQSWHWTDPERSVPEIARVLRPGGAVALWWNVADERVPWIAAQRARHLEACPAYAPHRDVTAPHHLGAAGFDPSTAELPWSRRVPLERHLTYLRSQSYVDALPDHGAAFLARERDHLLADVVTDGEVEEHYVCQVVLGRRP